ncbi:MAG: hypothetical protein HOG49_43770, partial [Candidatus Scalindua sp.]|nr:hypothetical protein [Candidatus Scalindua sp.]
MSKLNKIRYGKITGRKSNHFQIVEKDELMASQLRKTPTAGLGGGYQEVYGYASTVVDAKWFGKNKHLLIVECNSVMQKDYVRNNLPRFLCSKDHYNTKMAFIEYAPERYWIITNYIGTFKDCTDALQFLNKSNAVAKGFLQFTLDSNQMLLPCYPQENLVPRLLTYYDTKFHKNTGINICLELEVHEPSFQYEVVRNLEGFVVNFFPPNTPMSDHDTFMRWIKEFHGLWHSQLFGALIEEDTGEAWTENHPAYPVWTESESYLAEISNITAFYQGENAGVAGLPLGASSTTIPNY